MYINWWLIGWLPIYFPGTTNYSYLYVSPLVLSDAICFYIHILIVSYLIILFLEVVCHVIFVLINGNFCRINQVFLVSCLMLQSWMEYNLLMPWNYCWTHEGDKCQSWILCVMHSKKYGSCTGIESQGRKDVRGWNFLYHSAILTLYVLQISPI